MQSQEEAEEICYGRERRRCEEDRNRGRFDDAKWMALQREEGAVNQEMPAATRCRCTHQMHQETVSLLEAPETAQAYDIFTLAQRN